MVANHAIADHLSLRARVCARAEGRVYARIPPRVSPEAIETAKAWWLWNYSLDELKSWPSL